jgi:hypothetical protein
LLIAATVPHESEKRYSLVIYYNAVMGKKGAEVFFFGDNGKAIASIAHYDEL